MKKESYIFKETETLELKKSTSEIKEAVISIAAILNKHKNGTLYFGIKDDGSIIGQEIGADTLRDISRAINENLEPKLYPEIKEIKIDDKTCIIVEFEGFEIPYFAYGKAYMRVGVENNS